MKKSALAIGLFFALFSLTSVLAAGSINLKMVSPVTLSSDGLVSIGNNGTINLTNVVLNSVGLPQLSFPINHFDLSVPPAGTGYYIASRPHLLNPQDLHFGYNYFNITANSNENVSAMISSSVVRSFCINGSVGGPLLIDGVKIINLNGGATMWHAGDHVQVEVTLRDADTISHSDIVLKMGFFTSQGQDRVKNLDFLNAGDEVINVGTVNSGSVEKVIFDIVVPFDFSPRDYHLALKLYDRALGELVQCQDTNYDFDAFYYQNISVLPSLPVYSCQDLNESNGYYILQNDVYSPLNTNCFYVKASNVTFNMNGYTLSGANHGFGVYDNEADSFFLYGGNISNFTRGVMIEDSFNSGVENVSFSYSRKLQLEIAAGGNHTIRNNAFSDYGHSEEAVLISFNSSFNKLENNYFFDNDVGVVIKDSSYNTLQSSAIVKSGQGVILRNAPRNTIKDIIFKDNYNNLFIDAVSLDRCEQNISNLVGDGGKPVLYLRGENHLSNIEVNELVLCNAEKSTFDNILINSPSPRILQSGGIVVILTNNATFSNIFINNSHEGIHVLKSSNISVKDSLVQNSNSGNGIFIENSTDSSFTNSSFFWVYRGIEIGEGTNNNVFTRNNVRENTISLTIRNTNGYNLVYDNIFNSTQNSEFVGTNIYYLNTYMHKGKNIIGGRFLGGNYWADPDYKNGFSETCRDNNFDGLCDKPYIINPFVSDEIPLARKNIREAIPDY